jgi:hypothetical protein
MKFAEQIARGAGIGIDISPEHVAGAQGAALDVQQGDVLAFEGRSVATGSFAVDLMPELDGRRSFDLACANILRAASDYAVIQHLCFDSAEALLAQGLTVTTYTDKSIRFRPRAMDYVHFLQQYGSRLDIVGIAIFGHGEPKTKPAGLAGISGSLLARSAAQPLYRSLRVVFGRKNINRFHTAVRRARIGEALLLWEQPE